MIKINTSGDYVQLIYVDPVGESVQQELKSNTDAFECSYDSDGKLFMQFGAMRFENPDPTDFTINGVAVTDAADFISKLNALFTGGGGDGNGIYGGSGTLPGDVVVDLNGHDLEFLGPSSQLLLEIDQAQKYSTFMATPNGDVLSRIELSADAPNNVYFDLNTTDNVNPLVVKIHGDAVAGTIEYTADTHTMTGAVLMPSVIPLDFADDAAAAIGGVAVGQLYHNSGAVRIRRS